MLTIEKRPQFDANWTLVTGALAQESPSSLFVRAFEYPTGYIGHSHRHRLAQIVYPIHGVISVYAEQAQITVSPYRAVYVPSWLPHTVAAKGNTRMRSIFINPDDRLLRQQHSSNPSTPTSALTVLNVSPLLHELVCEAGLNYGAESHDTLAQQVLDLIRSLLFQHEANDGYVALPAIKHPRLRKLMLEPFDGGQSATAAAERVALSPRQFRRLFQADTGITYAQWRALARIRRAIEYLASGHSITEVATELGFSSPSAFTASFRRIVGASPSAFTMQRKQGARR